MLWRISQQDLGGIFDSVLSEREVISGWWTDGYRILIEAPRKLNKMNSPNCPKHFSA